MPAGLTPIQFDQLRATLTQAMTGAVLTPTGLVKLTPPVLSTPLESLASWLRIMRSAGITIIPEFQHGTAAWSRWKQLTRDPKTTEEQWGIFYARRARSS
ncbi:MAG: hypothetical protein LBK99_05130 [Opitutaceae bacterium]|nr:hypothetical protein [Opitutaceae bacterium]